MSSGDATRCLEPIGNSDTWYGKGQPSPIKSIRGMKDDFFEESLEGNAEDDTPQAETGGSTQSNEVEEVDVEDEELDESDR
jgi:hypothetical protein